MKRDINIELNDADFKELEKIKGDKSWRNFIEGLIDKL